jgi:outer membrane usher protein
VTITWRGQSCELDVSYPPNADPLPDLGTFLCKGVKP